MTPKRNVEPRPMKLIFISGTIYNTQFYITKWMLIRGFAQHPLSPMNEMTQKNSEICNTELSVKSKYREWSMIKELLR